MKPLSQSQRKNNSRGGRGEGRGSSLQLGSDWLHSLHLHLGQITQYGLPTTVCMTNDRGRANLQPTQPHTFTCNRKKSAHFSVITTCDTYLKAATILHVVSFETKHLFLCFLLPPLPLSSSNDVIAKLKRLLSNSIVRKL